MKAYLFALTLALALVAGGVQAQQAAPAAATKATPAGTPCPMMTGGTCPCPMAKAGCSCPHGCMHGNAGMMGPGMMGNGRAGNGRLNRMPAASTTANPQVFGWQLMTPEERTAYQAKMRAAKTPQERAKIRAEHHKEMLERAKQKGVTLPETPPGNSGG